MQYLDPQIFIRHQIRNTYIMQIDFGRGFIERKIDILRYSQHEEKSEHKNKCIPKGRKRKTINGARLYKNPCSDKNSVLQRHFVLHHMNSVYYPNIKTVDVELERYFTIFKKIIKNTLINYLMYTLHSYFKLFRSIK